MYSGINIRKGSGRVTGVHQKIDRVARRSLGGYISKSQKFPNIRSIIHFEGRNGPDGLKLKSCGIDEPWHFINPANPDDVDLLQVIDDHLYNLARAIKDENNVRAAFEAAWLAHAITDGLTPAHHYALDEKIEELWGKSHNERTSIKDKGLIRGNNRRDTISKNWQYWGAGGVFTAHLTYEMGVASVIAAEKYSYFKINNNDFELLKSSGYLAVFKKSLNEIYRLKIYDNYVKNGWTTARASQTKDILVPEIIKNVTLAWYQALTIARDME